MKSIKKYAVLLILSILVPFVASACTALEQQQKELLEIKVNTVSVKTIYVLNDEFTSEGLVVTAKYNTGEEEDVTSEVELDISNFNSQIAGPYEIIVKYGEFTTKYNVLVEEPEYVPVLEDFYIDTTYAKTIFYYNEEFNSFGLKVIGIFEDGVERDIYNYSVNSSAFKRTTPGTYAIKIKVDDIGEKNYDVTVLQQRFTLSELFNVTFNNYKASNYLALYTSTSNGNSVSNRTRVMKYNYSGKMHIKQTEFAGQFTYEEKNNKINEALNTLYATNPANDYNSFFGNNANGLRTINTVKSYMSSNNIIKVAERVAKKGTALEDKLIIYLYGEFLNAYTELNTMLGISFLKPYEPAVVQSGEKVIEVSGLLNNNTINYSIYFNSSTKRITRISRTENNVTVETMFNYGDRENSTKTNYTNTINNVFNATYSKLRSSLKYGYIKVNANSVANGASYRLNANNVYYNYKFSGITLNNENERNYLQNSLFSQMGSNANSNDYTFEQRKNFNSAISSLLKANYFDFYSRGTSHGFVNEFVGHMVIFDYAHYILVQNTNVKIEREANITTYVATGIINGVETTIRISYNTSNVLQKYEIINANTNALITSVYFVF